MCSSITTDGLNNNLGGEILAETIGVFVKGWKAPRYCEACPMRTGNYCGILAENEEISLTGRKDSCPLHEVSGNLIDRDAFLHELLYSAPELLADGKFIIQKLMKAKLVV